MTQKRVLLVDDHPLFREAVVLSIRQLDRTDFQVLEAGTLDEVYRLAAAMPDHGCDNPSGDVSMGNPGTSPLTNDTPPSVDR